MRRYDCMMSDLIPIEQKQIEFQGGKITAVMVQDENGRENVYIPLRPLVEGMGLNWSGQYTRIKKNPVLNDVCEFVRVTQTNKRGNPNKICIPISHVNGFLFGINANRVKSEIRPLLIEYQHKCYEALFQAFNGTESMRRFYSAIGHDSKWIETRITQHSIATTLNDVWLKNGVPIEYHDKLQDKMSEGSFGVTINEHRQLKQLPDGTNLHDNMTFIELAIQTLADATAIGISDNEAPSSFEENKDVATRAGEVAGKARRNYEEETGGKVLSEKNHLDKKRPLLGKGNTKDDSDAVK